MFYNLNLNLIFPDILQDKINPIEIKNNNLIMIRIQLTLNLHNYFLLYSIAYNTKYTYI